MRKTVAIAVGALSAALVVAGANAKLIRSDHFALRGTVTRVVDGNTLDIRLMSGKIERVRLIGVATPKRGACYAARAAAQTRALTLRKSVGLVGDRTQARRDRSGRLLAYVSAPRRPDVGRRLLEGGFARVLVVGRPFQRVIAYRSVQRTAQLAGRGMWTAYGGTPPPPPAPPPPPTPTADLAITKVATPNPVTVGTDLTYAVTVTNAGPASATDVSITDTPPPTVAITSATASQGTCAPAPLPTCALGTVAAGASATMTLVVRPTVPGMLTNTATVTGSTVDPNAANNTIAVSSGASGPPTPPPPPGACDPSYPDVCIPSPPPDLDCGDIPHRRFRVLPPDPHRFDGDGNGIGCES